MTPEDKRHLRRVYSLRDFELANSALAFLDELDLDEQHTKIELRRFRCFLESAAIAYWRPFAKADGLPALDFEMIGVAPTPDQQALHERIRIFRNKVVAHSDPERMRILLTSHRPLPDHDVQMPSLQFDEGLEFLDDRRLWRDWVGILIGALADYTFQVVQGSSPYRYERDYLQSSGQPAAAAASSAPFGAALLREWQTRRRNRDRSRLSGGCARHACISICRYPLLV